NSRRLIYEPPPPESVHRNFSLPQSGRRVLSTDLCSEYEAAFASASIPQLGVSARYTPFGGGLGHVGCGLVNLRWQTDQSFIAHTCYRLDNICEDWRGAWLFRVVSSCSR